MTSDGDRAAGDRRMSQEWISDWFPRTAADPPLPFHLVAGPGGHLLGIESAPRDVAVVRLESLETREGPPRRSGEEPRRWTHFRLLSLAGKGGRAGSETTRTEDRP